MVSAEGGPGVSARPASASWLPISVGALAVASAVLGGASAGPLWPRVVVELAALPALALALAGDGGRPLPPRVIPLLAILAAAIPALQLVPLPPAWWTRLAGRAPEAEALRQAGLPLAWRPASLYPGATLDALLALVPPAAMALAAARLSRVEQRQVLAAWMAVGLAGLMLGAAQIALPGPSGPYLYSITNYGSLVGFFANRNHEASFLLALAPLAAVLAGEEGAVAALARAFFVLAIVGLGVVQSRAGAILAVPALLGAAAIVLTRRSGGRRELSLLAGGAAAALIAVAVFALAPLFHRFEGTGSEFRFSAWPQALRLAWAHAPFGAGIGTFDRVWRAAEPLAQVGPTYFNHAHNDALELAIEGGWPAVAVMALFVAWWLATAVARVRRGPSLARAAALSIGLVLVHSLADYPLRTEAMAVLFAFACGIAAAGSRSVRA